MNTPVRHHCARRTSLTEKHSSEGGECCNSDSWQSLLDGSRLGDGPRWAVVEGWNCTSGHVEGEAR